MPDDPSTAPSRRKALGFGVTLTVAMALATIVPPAIGVLSPFLIADLGLARVQIGVLATVVPLAGALLAPFAGALVDTFGGRRMLVLLFSAVGTGLLTLAVAPSFPWLVVAAALAGIGFALGNVATNRLITVHLPPGGQGTIVGIKQSGVQVGAFVAGVMLPSLALLVGWRGASATAGVLALLAIPAIFAWVGADGPHTASGDRALRREQRKARGSWPPVRWLASYALFMGAGNGAVITYIPLYTYEEVGFSITTAGVATSTMALVAALTRIAWARASERRWTPQAILLALAIAATISQGVTIASSWLPPLLWIGVIGLGATAIAWNGVVMLFVVRSAPHALTGRVTGTIQLTFALGMVSSPSLFGLVVDLTQTYWVAWAGTAATHALAAGVMLFGRQRLRLATST